MTLLVGFPSPATEVENIECTDAPPHMFQDLDMGGPPQHVSDDDDETQVPTAAPFCSVQTGKEGRGEDWVEDDVEDDEILDPTWNQGHASDVGSSEKEVVASKCEAGAAVVNTPKKPQSISGSSCSLFCCCLRNRGCGSNTTTSITITKHVHTVRWKCSAVHPPNTGYSLTCKSCWHLSSVPCDGPSITCPPNQACVAALTTVNIVGQVSPQYSITCGTTNQCNLTGSFTFIYGKLLTGTSCCSSDNCTPPLPILPNQTSQTNGRKCRTCTSEKSDYCYTSDELQCTGEETKCGRMARTLSGTVNLKDALRGCTTRSFCDILGSQTTVINGLNVNMKTYCSDGAAELRVGYLFSIFTALMIKFIF